MEANTMDVSPEPEPENSTLLRSDKLNSEADALDSQSNPKEAIETVELLNDVASDSPTTASSSLEEVPPSCASDKSENTTDGNSAETPDTTAAEGTAPAEGGDEDSAEELKIPFAPGDHITRWEMLPIAWPIQVHGIVLEVHEDAVVLVDFGLAAVPKGKNHKKNKKKRGSWKQKKTEEAVESEPNNVVEESSENGEESEAKKQQQHVRKAIEKFQKGFKKERNRLNVQTLTTQKEISKWSKVNYDGGLFGFGNKDGEEKGNKNEQNGEQGSSDNKSSRKDKRESWWGNLMKAQEKKKAEREQRKKEKNADNTEENSTTANEEDNSIVTSTRSDGELVKIESSGSSTPTSVSGCGGIPACDTGGTPWWCRISMQRGKRRGSSSGKDEVTAAMLEASKNGELVQEYNKRSTNNSEEKEMDDDGHDFILELEKRRMRKSFQQQHSDYMASTTASDAADESVSSTIADGNTQGTQETGATKESTEADIFPDDEGETFEEEKKDEHEFSYESASSSKDKLSVMTDAGGGDVDTSQTEATSFDSPDASPEASPSSSKAESEESDDSSTGKSGSNSSSPKKRKHESKADPPEVVLARTRWLLKNGEGILPPYHAFSSNSECIAVFCKTGYWSTLQADIFLHSTAIGNAKSTVVMTLGVAASVPMLAPVVGAVGLGAIVAPWVYLDKQKKAARETQQRLADQFWAQAEPEVIVACVKAWSHLEEDTSVEGETSLPKIDETAGHAEAMNANGAGESSD